MNLQKLATYFDHTLLKADATSDDIKTLCLQGIQYLFSSVCIHPCWVIEAVELLKDYPVKVCSVVGFPLGANLTSTKIKETDYLLKAGCTEIDMVLNIGFLKDKNYSFLKEEIRAMRNLTEGNILKVIIETCYLNREEMLIVANILQEEGVDFLKTSTGFGPKGAILDDVLFLSSIIKPPMRIKASGGIRTLEETLRFIKAGASRIGSSSSPKIIEEYREKIKHASSTD